MICLLTPSQTVGPFFAIGLPWPGGPLVVPEDTPGAITISGRVLDGAGDPVPDALVETWQADPDGRFAHPDDPRRSVTEAPAGFRGFGRCPTDDAGRYRIITLRPGKLPCPDGGFEAPHLDVSVFARGMLDRVVTRIYFPDEAQANAADPVLAAIGDPRRRATLTAIAEPAEAAPDDRPGDIGPGLRGTPAGLTPNGQASDNQASDYGAGDNQASDNQVGENQASDNQVGDNQAGHNRVGDYRAGHNQANVFRFDIRLQGESETVFFDV